MTFLHFLSQCFPSLFSACIITCKAGFNSSCSCMSTGICHIRSTDSAPFRSSNSKEKSLNWHLHTWRPSRSNGMQPWGCLFASIATRPGSPSPIALDSTGPLWMQDNGIRIEDLGVERLTKHSLFVELIELLVFPSFPVIPVGWFLQLPSSKSTNRLLFWSGGFRSNGVEPQFDLFIGCIVMGDGIATSDTRNSPNSVHIKSKWMNIFIKLSWSQLCNNPIDVLLLPLFTWFGWFEVWLNLCMPKLFFIAVSVDNLTWLVNSITVSDCAFTFLFSKQFVDLGAHWTASASIIIWEHGRILWFGGVQIRRFGWLNEQIAFIKGPPWSVGCQFSFEAKFQLNLPSFHQSCCNSILHLCGVANWWTIHMGDEGSLEFPHGSFEVLVELASTWSGRNSSHTGSLREGIINSCHATIVCLAWQRHSPNKCSGKGTHMEGERFHTQEGWKITQSWGLSVVAPHSTTRSVAQRMQIFCAAFCKEKHCFAPKSLSQNELHTVPNVLRQRSQSKTVTLNAKNWPEVQGLIQRKKSCVLPLWCAREQRIIDNVCVEITPQFWFLRALSVFSETWLFSPPACGTAQERLDAEMSIAASFRDSLSLVFNEKWTFGGSSFKGRSEHRSSKQPCIAILTLSVPQSHQRKFPVAWGMLPRNVPFPEFDLNLAECRPTDLTHTLQTQTLSLLQSSLVLVASSSLLLDCPADGDKLKTQTAWRTAQGQNLTGRLAPINTAQTAFVTVWWHLSTEFHQEASGAAGCAAQPCFLKIFCICGLPCGSPPWSKVTNLFWHSTGAQVCRNLSMKSIGGAFDIWTSLWTVFVNLSLITRKHVSPLIPSASVRLFLSLDAMPAKAKLMLSPWHGTLASRECWPGGTFLSLAWTQAVHWSKTGHNGLPLNSGISLQHLWAWAVIAGEKWHSLCCHSFLFVLVCKAWAGVCWQMILWWGWFLSDDGSSSSSSCGVRSYSNQWVWMAVAAASLQDLRNAGLLTLAWLMSLWLVAIGWSFGRTGGVSGWAHAPPKMMTPARTESFQLTCLWWQVMTTLPVSDLQCFSNFSFPVNASWSWALVGSKHFWKVNLEWSLLWPVAWRRSCSFDEVEVNNGEQHVLTSIQPCGVRAGILMQPTATGVIMIFLSVAPCIRKGQGRWGVQKWTLCGRCRMLVAHWGFGSTINHCPCFCWIVGGVTVRCSCGVWMNTLFQFISIDANIGCNGHVSRWFGASRGWFNGFNWWWLCRSQCGLERITHHICTAGEACEGSGWCSNGSWWHLCRFNWQSGGWNQWNVRWVGGRSWLIGLVGWLPLWPSDLCLIQFPFLGLLSHTLLGSHLRALLIVQPVPLRVFLPSFQLWDFVNIAGNFSKQRGAIWRLLLNHQWFQLAPFVFLGIGSDFRLQSGWKFAIHQLALLGDFLNITSNFRLLLCHWWFQMAPSVFLVITSRFRLQSGWELTIQQLWMQSGWEFAIWHWSWVTGRSFGRWFGWSSGLAVGWSFGWSVRWTIHWRFGWRRRRNIGWMIGRSIGRNLCWAIGWNLVQWIRWSPGRWIRWWIRRSIQWKIQRIMWRRIGWTIQWRIWRTVRSVEMWCIPRTIGWWKRWRIWWRLWVCLDWGDIGTLLGWTALLSPMSRTANRKTSTRSTRVDHIMKDLRWDNTRVDAVDGTMKWHGKERSPRSMLIAKVIQHPAQPKCCSLSASSESESVTGSETMVQSVGAVWALMQLMGCAAGVWEKMVGLVRAEANWEPTELIAWTGAGAGTSTGAMDGSWTDADERACVGTAAGGGNCGGCIGLQALPIWFWWACAIWQPLLRRLTILLNTLKVLGVLAVMEGHSAKEWPAWPQMRHGLFLQKAGSLTSFLICIAAPPISWKASSLLESSGSNWTELMHTSMWSTATGHGSWAVESWQSLVIPLILQGFCWEGKEETVDPNAETVELLECLDPECCLTNLVMVGGKVPFWCLWALCGRFLSCSTTSNRLTLREWRNSSCCLTVLKSMFSLSRCALIPMQNSQQNWWSSKAWWGFWAGLRQQSGVTRWRAGWQTSNNFLRALWQHLDSHVWHTPEGLEEVHSWIAAVWGFHCHTCWGQAEEALGNQHCCHPNDNQPQIPWEHHTFWHHQLDAHNDCIGSNEAPSKCGSSRSQKHDCHGKWESWNGISWDWMNWFHQCCTNGHSVKWRTCCALVETEQNCILLVWEVHPSHVEWSVGCWSESGIPCVSWCWNLPQHSLHQPHLWEASWDWKCLQDQQMQLLLAVQGRNLAHQKWPCIDQQDQEMASLDCPSLWSRLEPASHQSDHTFQQCNQPLQSWKSHWNQQTQDQQQLAQKDHCKEEWNHWPSLEMNHQEIDPAPLPWELVQRQEKQIGDPEGHWLSAQAVESHWELTSSSLSWVFCLWAWQETDCQSDANRGLVHCKLERWSQGQCGFQRVHLVWKHVCPGLSSLVGTLLGVSIDCSEFCSWRWHPQAKEWVSECWQWGPCSTWLQPCESEDRRLALWLKSHAWSWNHRSEENQFDPHRGRTCRVCWTSLGTSPCQTPSWTCPTELRTVSQGTHSWCEQWQLDHCHACQTWLNQRIQRMWTKMRKIHRHHHRHWNHQFLWQRRSLLHCCHWCKSQQQSFQQWSHQRPFPWGWQDCRVHQFHQLLHHLWSLHQHQQEFHHQHLQRFHFQFQLEIQCPLQSRSCLWLGLDSEPCGMPSSGPTGMLPSESTGIPPLGPAGIPPLEPAGIPPLKPTGMASGLQASEWLALGFPAPGFPWWTPSAPPWGTPTKSGLGSLPWGSLTGNSLGLETGVILKVTVGLMRVVFDVCVAPLWKVPKDTTGWIEGDCNEFSRFNGKWPWLLRLPPGNPTRRHRSRWIRRCTGRTPPVWSAQPPSLFFTANQWGTRENLRWQVQWSGWSGMLKAIQGQREPPESRRSHWRNQWRMQDQSKWEAAGGDLCQRDHRLIPWHPTSLNLE